MFRRNNSRWLAPLAFFTSALLLLGVFQSVGVSPAQAADAREFNAGNIISDELFYNGSAMSEAEVQSFLSTRIGRCTIGDPGRAPGSAWGSTTIANTCMSGYTMSTSSKAANAYCSAYAGRSNESAAQIIARVGRACDISQKVLLVMLEKEQSLVQDTWPSNRQFDVAMGYACPDSGPNNSANCDSAYYGFFNQVYRAAWQLKVYKAFPTSYNYRPFQVNNIQWHPDAGCGTSQVYIENWATAALYIYTPYRPNQAALNAQWGTGDACSTYGNRNFFMFYSTWFGSPAAPAYPQIDSKFAQNSWLGKATSDYNISNANGGGVVRGYENGAITWQSGSSQAYIVTGEFRTYFNANGGLAGTISWPNSDQIPQARGITQSFVGAAISQLGSGQLVQLSGQTRTHFAAVFAYNGPLGWPTANQFCTGSASCTQAFENGSIVLSGSTPSAQIPAIDTKAATLGATLGSKVGAPQATKSNGGGFAQAFTNGAIAWSPTYGAFSVTGKIRTAFNSAGGLGGAYGWPTSEQTCTPSGACSQDFSGGTLNIDSKGNVLRIDKRIAASYEEFEAAGMGLGKSLGDTARITQGAGGLVHSFENGAIAVSDRTGAFAVMAPIRAPFNASGGLGGPLGWPTENSVSVPGETGGGRIQSFEGGAITSHSAGSFALTGKIHEKFLAAGGPAGDLGWPQSSQNQSSAYDGGFVQGFENGAITLHSGAASAYIVSGDIRTVFNTRGGLSGEFGWPVTDPVSNASNGGGTVQGFTGGAIASSPFGTYPVTGEIRTFFNANGGLGGSLGWPKSEMTCTSSACRQEFQGGTVTWSAGEGGQIS